jgi:D-glycero-D-manno-heptose 1,7-bisphosphate phosphatase
MVYYPEHGLVDSPFTPSQFVLTEGIGELLRGVKESGYELILVSNQPGIAKGNFTLATFERTRMRMNALLGHEDVELDAEYYCFHHPRAKFAKYRMECDCRKPKPGMLLKAASEHDLSLTDSIMIGDGLSDIIAGKSARCKTVLITNLNSFMTRLMIEKRVEPDYIAQDITEVIDIVKGMNGVADQY